MALSNWDCLSFDSDGKPCEGKFETKEGIKIQIYKNWVYVHFGNKTIQVDHGELIVYGVHLKVERHSLQQSVFVYVDSCCHGVCFCGLGCYGFLDTLDWLEKNEPKEYAKIDSKYLTPEAQEDVFISEFCGPGDTWGFDFEFNGEHQIHVVSCKRPGLDALWVGTTKETVEAFYQWLKTIAPESYWNKVDIDGAFRFNQGDAYFASALGKNNLMQATPPGESKSPIFNILTQVQK